MKDFIKTCFLDLFCAVMWIANIVVTLIRGKEVSMRTYVITAALLVCYILLVASLKYHYITRRWGK